MFIKNICIAIIARKNFFLIFCFQSKEKKVVLVMLIGLFVPTCAVSTQKKENNKKEFFFVPTHYHVNDESTLAITKPDFLLDIILFSITLTTNDFFLQRIYEQKQFCLSFNLFIIIVISTC